MQEREPFQETHHPAPPTSCDSDADIELLQVTSQSPSRQTSTIPPSEDVLRASLAADLSSLSEEALLAMVLRTSSKQGGSPTAQAQRLLASFGNIRELARAGRAELAQIGGIPQAKAAAISAALELGRRYATTPHDRGQIFSSSADVFAHFGPRLSVCEQETFWVLLLNQRKQLLRQLEIAKGSINRCPVMPVDIFAPAIREKAVAMVLIHNHPSGDPEPSRDDRSLTRRLVHIADLHAIEILDHLVIGDQRYVSFADRGWL